MRIRAVIEYVGTGYAGWQLQPNAVTVQGAIEQALAVALRHHCRVYAAGRTDSGVHAEGQVAAFDAADDTDLYRLLQSLNGLTPYDMNVVSLEHVADDFDPRRHAIARTYRYEIVNARPPSPFYRQRCWHIIAPLQVEELSRISVLLLGKHDFTAFRSADCGADRTVRHVTACQWTRTADPSGVGQRLTFTITCNSFLKQMVRILIGSMVGVVRGDLSETAFRSALQGGDRRTVGVTAPAEGLTLVGVHYADVT